MILNEKSARIQTVISQKMIDDTLIRGTILAAIGGGMCLLSAIAMPLSSMEKWGWLIFLCAGMMIAIGLLPYKRLIRLQSKPNEIVIFKEKGEFIEYVTFSKVRFLIPLYALQSVSYLQTDTIYGMGLRFDKSFSLPKEIKALQTHEGLNFKYDCFLPYFSKEAALDLRSFI